MISDFQQEISNRKLMMKKDIKKIGGNCAKMLLILGISVYAINFVIILVIKFRAKSLGMDTISSIDANTILGISRDKYNFFVGYLPCVLGDIIAIIIGMKTINVKIKKDLFNKIKSSKTFMLLGTISCIGTGMISGIIYSIYSTIFNSKGIVIPKPDFSFPAQSEYLILFLLYACFLGPILEEIIFRGFILKGMQKYGNLTSIIVSSILFSMFHLNLVQFVNPILMGIVLAFIAIKSQSIIASIIAHIFNNSITFTVLWISSLDMSTVQLLFNSLYLFIGILSFMLFVSKYRKEFFDLIKENTRILTTYEKVRCFFSGAWALSYIGFYIIFVMGSIIFTNLIKK